MSADVAWAQEPAAPLEFAPEPSRARQRVAAWGLFLGAVVVVLSTLDLAYDVSLYLRGRGLMLKTVLTLAGAVGLFFFYAVTVGAGVRSLLPFVRALPPFALFVYAMITMRAAPSERFHFVEYGALAMLALRAVAVDVRSVLAYPIAIVVASAAGVLDEYLQGRSDVRIFDAIDLCVNLVAVILAIMMAAALFGRDVARARFPHLAARRVPEA